MKPNKLTFNVEMKREAKKQSHDDYYTKALKQYYDEVFMPEKQMSLSGYKALSPKDIYYFFRCSSTAINKRLISIGLVM